MVLGKVLEQQVGDTGVPEGRLNGFSRTFEDGVRLWKLVHPFLPPVQLREVSYLESPPPTGLRAAVLKTPEAPKVRYTEVEKVLALHCLAVEE